MGSDSHSVTLRRRLGTHVGSRPVTSGSGAGVATGSASDSASDSEAHSAIGDIRTTAAVLAAQLDRYEDVPNDLAGLHDYCDTIRKFETALERWFGETDGGLVFRRGKHRGEALDQVAREKPDYLRWMLGAQDMDPDVLDVVRKALVACSG